MRGKTLMHYYRLYKIKLSNAPPPWELPSIGSATEPACSWLATASILGCELKTDKSRNTGAGLDGSIFEDQRLLLAPGTIHDQAQ